MTVIDTQVRLRKRLNAAAWIISAVVLFLVGLMRQVKIDVPYDLSFLPAVNATINSLTAIVLLYAFVQIRQRKIENHRKAIYLALGLSAVFLLGYVAYHFTSTETVYCKEGAVRSVYYFVLITHVVLAAIIFPFVLFTFVRGFTGQYQRHKRMARWVWPIWFYVAVTGPIVYIMLRPCYG